MQVEALAGVPLLLAPELLERGVDHQPLYVSLHNAELDVACEALAQGMATWWLRTAQDRILFTDQVHIPLGPLTTLTRSSSLKQQDELLPLLQQALTPWLGHGTGLTTHPSKNRIIATLDDAGHQRLLTLLNLLESGQARLPPLQAPIPTVAVPAAATWSELLDHAQPGRNICQAFGFAPGAAPPIPYQCGVATRLNYSLSTGAIRHGSTRPIAYAWPFGRFRTLTMTVQQLVAYSLSA